MKTTMKKYHLVLLVCLVGLFSPVLHAAHKALLIGTTSYASEQNNLPGIDLDLAEMNRVVRKLGFTEENVLTLKGEDVTLGNVTYQFSSFLNENVLPGDTVLIYYSGHGVQVPDKDGDEADGADEAISLYDLEGTYVDGAVVWDGVLLDDQLAELINGLVSENVIVIVDACHSGTVTRSFTGAKRVDSKAYGDSSFAVKSLGPPIEATRSLSSTADSIVDKSVTGVITLSAAQDNEEALASSKGSLFTLALGDTLDSQRKQASPQSLVDAASQILDDRLDDDLYHQPNLTGDESLFSKPIVLTDAADRGEVNQGDLLILANEVSPLRVEPTSDRYFQNELITLGIDVPVDGYLNVLAVDSDDQMVVLYPNGIDTNNNVSAGEPSLPGTRNFEWAAQEPWGATMVTVLFSQEPVNLFESSIQRSASGEAIADYILPSISGLKSYQAAAGLKAAGVAFVKTCLTSADCS